MLTKEQAEAVAVAELNDDNVSILVDQTIERHWGWMFFYQSKRWIETRDLRDAIIGNAPVFVNRDTGECRFIGTSQTVAEQIEAYEKLLVAKE
jgi:alkanesulfonate monooxygenase SsuD/methylene tetrahydromethanopterin reductase-like flavin-dependent oxidoreductase (luciferase family)